MLAYNSTTGEKLKPYQKGLFEYNECFFGKGGFLTPDSNEEKHLIGFYLQVLAEALRHKGIVFCRNEPIKWLEPGIGDGSSTKKFLQAVGVTHSAGFIVYGSDIQEESVKLAKQNLSKVEGIRVELAEVLVTDAFSGELLASEQCDFGLCSHFIYHLKNMLDGSTLTEKQITEKLESFVKGLMNSILPDGLVLLFHEGPKSEMFGNIGRKYGSSMHDATERIARAAAANGKELVAIPLESKLYFPPLSNETLRLFEKVENWKRFLPDSAAASWLKKFLFALHEVEKKDPRGNLVSPGGALALEQRGTLPNAIRYTRELLDRHGGYIIIRSEMQGVLNNPQLRPKLEAAFQEVENRRQEIQQKTEAEMLKA